jgi:hypothetical protein
LEVFAIVDLADFPEAEDGTIANLVIEPEPNTASLGVVFAVDDGLEPVVGPDKHWWVNALNAAVFDSLGIGKQAGQAEYGAVLQLWVCDF